MKLEQISDEELIVKLEQISDEELLDVFGKLASHNYMVLHTQPYAGNLTQKYNTVRMELLLRLKSRLAFINRFDKIMKGVHSECMLHATASYERTVLFSSLKKLQNEALEELSDENKE